MSPTAALVPLSGIGPIGVGMVRRLLMSRYGITAMKP